MEIRRLDPGDPLQAERAFALLELAAINERLGFHPVDARVSYKRTFER